MKQRTRLRRQYCTRCRGPQFHEVTSPDHTLPLVATLFTYPWWTPMWLFSAVFKAAHQCQQCGKRQLKVVPVQLVATVAVTLSTTVVVIGVAIAVLLNNALR